MTRKSPSYPALWECLDAKALSQHLQMGHQLKPEAPFCGVCFNASKREQNLRLYWKKFSSIIFRIDFVVKLVAESVSGKVRKERGEDRGWRDGSRLRALAGLGEDAGSVSSSHIGQRTMSVTSASGDPMHWSPRTLAYTWGPCPSQIKNK